MLSRFAPPGHRKISGEEPLGKRFYLDKVRNYGADDNFPDDEYLRGKLYADAMLSASVQLLMDRAKAELHPLSTQTFLPLHEAELGLVPQPGDTLHTRRKRVHLFKRLALDGRYSSILDALIELLGSSLVFYRTTRFSELLPFDRSPQSRGDFNHVGRDVPVRVVKTLAAIVRLGVSLPVPIEFFGGSPAQYSVGQTLLIDPANSKLGERIVVEAATDTTITATFTKPHGEGVVITSGHFPKYPSIKRVHHILLSSGATDPSVRNVINLLMHRVVKGTATWQVLEETSVGTAGPFILDQSPMDATPFGEVTK